MQPRQHLADLGIPGFFCKHLVQDRFGSGILLLFDAPAGLGQEIRRLPGTRGGTGSRFDGSRRSPARFFKMLDELFGFAVGRIDAQDRLVRLLGLGIALLSRPFSPQLKVDFGGFVLHVFLQAEFRHTLLGVEVGGVLADDFLVDIERFFGFALLQVILAERQIILDGAAQQPPLRVQIAEMPVHLIAGGVELEDFFVRSDRFEGGALGTEGVGGLDKRGDGIDGRIALQMEVAD